MRHFAKLNHNFCHFVAHTFACAQKKRHPSPTPILDLRLQSDKGFGVTASGCVGLIGISGHSHAIDAACLVLPPHHLLGHIAWSQRLQRLQYLDFLIAHRIGL